MAGYIGKSQGKILTNVEGNSVETADIQDSAVTETKIAAGSVTDSKLNSTKLDGIEAGATADQTGAEIKAAYEGEANTNAYTDAEKTKLSGIEAGADVTDATNVTAAGALMDSEVTNLAAVKAFDPTDYATAAQGTKADSALQSSDIGVSIQAYSATLAGTTASFTTADETKLDGIEAGADVTDTANVTAAGALMDSEVTNLAQVKAFDSTDYATAAQGALADSALQPSDIGTAVLSPTGDGSNLTGITAYTKSSSNPATNTNGSAGDIWVNYSSGKIYICTDATTNANVWRNIHDSTDIIYPNDAPSNPTNTGSFPSTKYNSDTFTFTFSGATDPNTGYGDSVVAYLVDTFSSAGLTVATAEVSAGSAHSFTVANISVDETLTFRVRAKDNYGAYSTGTTISIDLVADVGITATGGTITESGDYRYHKFTSSGTFAVSSLGNQTPTMEYLVVAGGGSGGPTGGGGGAGGVRSSSATATVSNYTVTIGAGGAQKSYSSGGQSNDGSSSSFNGLSSTGGGGGGAITSGGESSGRSGGSGGGGCHSGAGRSGGAGISGQGNSGGNNQASPPYPTGGGGGKGGAGGNASGSSSGAGGAGYTWNSFITVGGGGGGGGGDNWGNVVGASGGSGGGGQGGYYNGATGQAGTANTGGGGGGGSYPAADTGDGGAGGSGVVVIRYKFQNF